MSSIVYSFHWVRQSLDRKKQQQQEHHLESNESTSTTDIPMKSKLFSLIWFDQLFKTYPEHQYPQFDFEFLHNILFIIIPTSKTYSVLNRTPNKIDYPNLIYDRTTIHSKLIIDKCIPVQAVRQTQCPFNDQAVFKSVCEQHRLCYACGFVHHITAEQCVKLSRMHMHNKCSGKSDCLKSRETLFTRLEQDFYRTSNFSFECHDKCVLNYLYTIFE